jgi:CheY-like chemotaxis protein
MSHRPPAPKGPSAGDASAPAVLVVGTDDPTRELLREWLADAGWRVVVDLALDALPATAYALVLVDVPFPRQGRSTPALARLAADHAGTPVLALSATFHSSVERSGAVAQALGVAGVLPKPIRRETLVAAVRHLSRPPS